MRLFIALMLSSLTAWSAPLFEKHSGGTKMTHWFFRQKLDSSPGAPEFRQRVLTATVEADDVQTAPVFIKICGEDECLPMFPGILDVLARKHHGIKVMIEHRFYGISHPFAELTPENLRYLSTQHALDDLVRVLQAFRTEWGWRGPLIPIGCSYPGMLAAFLRAQHPDLVIGAAAVSAPVQARTLVPERDVFYARRLSPECAAVVRRVVRDYEHKVLSFTGEDFTNEMKALGFKNPAISASTFINILGDWAANFSGRSAREAECPKLHEASFLAGLFKEFLEKGFGEANGSLDAARETSVARIGSGGAVRQWTYQTCTEFGFFQVSDPANGLGPLTKDASSKIEMCRELFGLETLPDDRAYNRRYFEPMMSAASNIIFANTAPDFWTQLSVLPANNTNPALQTVVGAEGGHCSPMSDITRGVPGPVTGALIEAIDGWLAKRPTEM